MKSLIFIPIVTLCFALISCEKGFLEAKPDKALVVPRTLEDFQNLLNDDAIMNVASGFGVIGADDYYMTDAGWLALRNPVEKNGYIWAVDIYEGTSTSSWNTPYEQVFKANVVLEGLDKLTVKSSQQAEWRRIKGSALFYRAYAFYHLAQIFAAPYNKQTAANSLGIPLKRSADINDVPRRGTLQQTYDQVVGDLMEAMSLLPLQSDYKTRPSKTAVYALLARMYLSMEKYEQAGIYADSSLKVHNFLQDYNDLSATAARPINRKNPEIIYQNRFISHGIFTSSATIIDSNLYRSYDNNDLRKKIFFNDRGNGVINFKGSYDGTTNLFGGLVTDEMYLIRAECYARAGKTADALSDLNTLLKTRWKTGTFVNLTAATADDALKLILAERRKELVFRGLRWSDLRRLNKDSRFSLTLIRKVNGSTYTLLPNDKRYVYPIPNEEIMLSGIEQNER